MKQNSSSQEHIASALPYTVLAQIYDKMMSHVNYHKWAKYISKIIKRERDLSGQALLDIGCGTGRFLQEMKKLGHIGDGCDQSVDMLKIAQKRLQGSRLYHSNLPFIEKIPLNTYHIVTALYDTMNYLLHFMSFEQALQNIYKRLKSPGIFIFDMVSRAHCQYYFKHYRDNKILDDHFAYSREGYYDSKQHIQFNWIQVYTPEGIYEEEHKQHIYHLNDIKRLIREKTGFTIKHFYQEFSFVLANSKSHRVHFVLKK